jgi:hypothetical protein
MTVMLAAPSGRARRSEVDAEIVLEAAQHHLEHLAQFLVRADRMRGAVEQLHALELHLELALGDTKSSMSVFEPNHLRMRPAGSRSGTARVLNQR